MIRRGFRKCPSRVAVGLNDASILCLGGGV
jgi:hypothetical protein